MSPFFDRHPAARWSAPLTVVALIAGGQLVTHTTADAAPNLPARTPEQLVAAAVQANVPNLSGTVQSTANLGLPQLPSQLSSSSVGTLPIALLSGTNTMRVWFAGNEGARVALLGDGSETDLIANRSDVWLWNSADRSAQHLALPSTTGHGGRSKTQSGADKYTPQGAAAWALKQLGQSTAVSSSTNLTVAGRAAYDLVLTPKQTATKVGSVHIAIDAKTSIPLQVKVFARGSSSAALSIGFTSISYAKPASSMFRFTPPSGTTVTPLKKSPSATNHTKPSTGSAKSPSRTGSSGRVVGTNWESVFIGTIPSLTNSRTNSGTGQASALLDGLPKVSGSWGTGHLLDTALFSAVITDKGTLAVGAVSSSTLLAALAK